MGNTIDVEVNIDCAPGPIRPDCFLHIVTDRLEPSECSLCSKFFGNWRWTLRGVNAEVYKEELDCISDDFNTLYEEGRVRYFRIAMIDT